MQLSESTWTEIEDVTQTTDLAVLPVGSTEQHGPHAPLGTDTITAREIAAAGTERYEGRVVVGPTVPVGIAAEHRQFTGTLWVSEETFRRYVRETIESFIHHDLTRVVVVNGHGGNVDALREVCAGISRTTEGYTAPFTWFNAVSIEQEMGHGGPLETALLRRLQPELIRADRIEDARAGGAERWGEWQSGTNLAYDSSEFTDSGVVGDPSNGDTALGEELLTQAATALCELLDAVTARDLTSPEHH